MLQLHLASVPTTLSEVEWALLASKTEGYSGSDIATFCSDAAMMPVRELEGASHWKVLTGEGQHCTSTARLAPCEWEQHYLSTDRNLAGSIW